jgi:spore germination protein GerM
LLVGKSPVIITPLTVEGCSRQSIVDELGRIVDEPVTKPAFADPQPPE